MDIFSVEARTAIVTGASSGLGERWARTLHEHGANVVAAARRRDRLDRLADECDGLVPVTCDVTVEADVAGLVEAATGAFGAVDVLVNNAGTGGPMPAEDEPLERVREVLDVNVLGVFAVAQAVGRHMLDRRRGSIVNVASVLGLVASAPIKQASYCASKGAVVNLTRELACQWARKGVRVNAIAPGWFPSEMTADMETDEGSAAFIGRNCPMARFGEVHELDGALLFLASDASSYVTGQVLCVDGGWTAR
jgi:hypothetical protein